MSVCIICLENSPMRGGELLISGVVRVFNKYRMTGSILDTLSL